MPLLVKNMANSFWGLSRRPHPTTSSFSFAFGLMALFGHSKACFSLLIKQQSTKAMEKE
jgi:hypothetical protein